MNDDDRQKLALWRYAILGPLVSMRRTHGDLREQLREAASKHYAHPFNGRLVQVSARTLETWHYRYHAEGLAGLAPKPRSDRGRSRGLDPALVDLIVRAKREKPRRSIRRIIKILERAGQAKRGELSRSTVHRILKRANISARPAREPKRERRSFILEHLGDLWVGDAKHGPRVIYGGRRRKSYAVNLIDCATRFIVDSRMCLSEGAVDHEGVFKEALRTYGCPRAYYVDGGSAYKSSSLAKICADLGIHLIHTLPGDAEAKGVIERWQRTWGEEVLDELPEDELLELADLQSKHWAWVACEYHRREHETTEREPLGHMLAELEAGHLRTLPAGVDLDEVFLHRAKRKVRKNGTVRFFGRTLEVLAELVGETIELRWDPNEPDELPRVWRDGAFVCDTVELDLLANASRKRKVIKPPPEPELEPTGLDPLGDLEREHYGPHLGHDGGEQ
jgi:transposase InsO family protein